MIPSLVALTPEMARAEMAEREREIERIARIRLARSLRRARR